MNQKKRIWLPLAAALMLGLIGCQQHDASAERSIVAKHIANAASKVGPKFE